MTSMKRIMTVAAVSLAVIASAAGSELAPTGTLRATFIDSNPAQARLNPATGEVRGVAADLTAELARQQGVSFTIAPAPGVAGVIASVKNGTADIGFVAYDATRAQEVDFSQTYLLAHNSYIVRNVSTAQTVKDIDRDGIRIGVGERDAADLFLTRVLKDATLRRIPNSDLVAGIRALKAGEIDAYGANRTRLLAVAAENPDLRLLPDNFYSVEQAIIVAKDRPVPRGIVEKFVAETKASGFVAAAIARADLRGVDIAPPK